MPPTLSLGRPCPGMAWRGLHAGLCEPSQARALGHVGFCAGRRVPCTCCPSVPGTRCAVRGMSLLRPWATTTQNLCSSEPCNLHTLPIHVTSKSKRLCVSRACSRADFAPVGDLCSEASSRSPGNRSPAPSWFHLYGDLESSRGLQGPKAWTGRVAPEPLLLTRMTCCGPCPWGLA